MNRARRNLFVCLAAFSSSLATASGPAAQALDALDGKTVRFIIGANAGGSTDRYARLFIDALRPLLPNATLVAQNLAGGDGYLAIAEASTAGPNAITLVFVQTGPIYEQLRQASSPSIDIGQFHPIGSLATNQRVVGVRASLGATTFEELVALDRHLITPTNSATAANHMEAVLVGAATGIRIRPIVGLQDELRDPMMMAGEVDLSVASYLNLRPLFQSGTAIPVLRTGSSDYLPDLALLPTLADVVAPGTPPELIEVMDTLNLLGRLLMAVPHTDPAAVEALRASFDAVVTSPEVVALYAAQSLDLSPTPGEEVERRMAALLGDEDAGAVFRSFLACGEEEAAAGTPVDCSAR